ncbi:MAG: hypothetical protein J4F37_11715 [Acidobacteria bacterium]|nr:hypothetical protein [Acidobacteriota bacterium]
MAMANHARDGDPAARRELDRAVIRLRPRTRLRLARPEAGADVAPVHRADGTPLGELAVGRSGEGWTVALSPAEGVAPGDPELEGLRQLIASLAPPEPPYPERQKPRWRRGRAVARAPGSRGAASVEVPGWLYGDFAVHRPFVGRPASLEWDGPAVTATALQEQIGSRPASDPVGAAAQRSRARMATGRTFPSVFRAYATAAVRTGDAAPWHGLAAALGGAVRVSLEAPTPGRAGWTLTHLGTGLPVLAQGASFRRLGDAKEAVERIDPAFERLADARGDAAALAASPVFARAAARVRAMHAASRSRGLLLRKLGRARRASRRAGERLVALEDAIETHDAAAASLGLGPSAADRAALPPDPEDRGEIDGTRFHAGLVDTGGRVLGLWPRAAVAIADYRPEGFLPPASLAAAERGGAALFLVGPDGASGPRPLAPAQAAGLAARLRLAEGGEAAIDGRRYSAAADHVIGDAAALTAGRPADKAEANLAAVELLALLRDEEREPSPDERRLLAGFRGWGGLPGLFDYDASRSIPASAKQELERALSAEDYAAVRRATQNSHYTDPRIGQAMYRGLERLGFAGGRVLEPGCGAGWFIGAMPEALRGETRVTGVEADPVAAGIARALYPSHDIRTARLEETLLPDGFFDAAIGNVPFSDTRPADPRYRALRPTTHDYFLLRAVDSLKPGGVALLLTSTGTLERKSAAIREALADRAELLDAVRLPAGAHRGVGTEALSDLLVLRKRPRALSAMPGEQAAAIRAAERGWAAIGTIADPEGGEDIPVNEFLAADPGRILGRPGWGKDSFGNRAMTVAADGGIDVIAAALAERLAALPGPTSAEPEAPPPAAVETPLVMAPGETKEGGFFVDGEDRLMVSRRGVGVPAGLPARGEAAIRDALQVRDALRASIRAQLDGAPEEARAASRAELNAAYDSFVAAHGALRDHARALRRDPDGPLLLALEDPAADGTVKKAAAFARDTVRPLPGEGSAEDPAAALARVLDETGRADLGRMAALLGLDGEEEAAEAARGLVWRLPGGGWASASEYLSGDVRSKLAEAEIAAAHDPRFAGNVRALEAVQPDDVGHEDIELRLGAPLPTAEDYRDFIAESLGVGSEDIAVSHDETAGRWYVRAATPRGKGARRGVAATRELGTRHVDGLALVEKAMNARPITVTARDGEGKAYLDVPATMAARGKEQLWQDRFRRWIWADPERRQRLVRLYNERFNRHVQRRYDGAHLTFPGMSRDWAAMMRPHQADAVWRSLASGGNTLLAHEVGTGKSLELAAIAQESKRIGKASKTLVAVPGAVLQEFAAKYRAAYPAANLLVWPEKKSVGAAERREFFSRAATGEWDAIVVTHDAFDLLRASPESETRMLRAQCDELRSARRAAVEDKGDARHVKRLANAEDKLIARIGKLIDTGREDNTVYFEDLGVDQLLIDEAQRYKNLFIATQMRNLKGLGTGDSQRAAQLFSKIDSLNRQRGEGAVVLATGTPISNSLAELYTLQRYLQPAELSARGLAAFDSWAGMFASPETRIGIDVAGRHRPTTRLARYVNLPELKQMTDQVVDTVFARDVEDMDLPEGLASTVALPASAAQKRFIAALAGRAAALGQVDPRDDNMLKISTEGRMAALDMRLLDPLAEDHPGSKVNDLAGRVARIHADNPEAAQLIFFDLGVNPTQYNPDFSLREEIRSKLVEAGIPDAEIGDFFSAAGAEREALKAGLRDGRIRIGMGSTEKLGTGTDVQDRLLALHHVDAPWTPASVDQRNGRGRRQGNRWERVHLYPYVTQGTFDAFSWQLLDSKKRFIDQFMRSDGVGRQMHDHEVDQLTPGQVMAIAIGDPVALYRAELEADLSALQASAEAHRREQAEMASSAEALDEEIAAIDARRAGAALAARQATRARQAEPVLRPEAGGRAVRGRRAVGNRMTAALGRRRDEAARAGYPAPPPTPAGSWRGVPLEAAGGGYGEPAHLALVMEDGSRWRIRLNPERPDGAAAAADAQLRRVDAEPGRLAAARSERMADRAKLDELLGRPFPGEAELALKRGEIERIERVAALPGAKQERVDELAETHPDLAYGAIVERVDALLDAAQEDRAQAMEAAAWHALAARRHPAIAGAAPPEIPMPVAEGDGLRIRSVPQPDGDGARYARAPARPEGLALDPAEESARGWLTDRVYHVWSERDPPHEWARDLGRWATNEASRMAPFAEIRPAGKIAVPGEPDRGDTAGGYVVARDRRDGRPRHIILLNVYATDNVEETLAHEIIHALRRSGRFTEEEWASLTDPRLIGRWREGFDIEHFYAGYGASLRDEECCAASFAVAWRAAGHRDERRPRLRETEDPDPEIAAAASRAEEIFRAVAAGEIGRRPEDPRAVRDALAFFDRPTVRFSLGRPRLHFDREGFRPLASLLPQDRLLEIALDLPWAESADDAAIEEMIAAGLVEPAPENAADYRHERRLLEERGLDLEAAEREARLSLAYRRIENDPDLDRQHAERVRGRLLAMLDRAQGVADTAGHGYLIATFDDHVSYTPLDPDRAVVGYGDGSFRAAAEACRRDAALWQPEARPCNPPGPAGRWVKRSVRPAWAQPRPGHVRGDFGIARKSPGGPFMAVHLPSGLPLSSNCRLVVSREPEKLRELVEALQPAFAWRSLTAPADVRALLEDDDDRGAHVRRALQDYVAGGDWRAPLAAARRGASLSLLRGGSGSARYSLGRALLDFDRGALRPAEQVLAFHQLRALAEDWYGPDEGYEQAREWAVDRAAEGIVEDAVRETDEFSADLALFGEEEAVARGVRSLAAAEVDDEVGDWFSEIWRSAGEIAVERFLGERSGEALAVLDTNGHGYALVSHGGEWLAIAPHGELCGDGLEANRSFESAAQLAREDAAQPAVPGRRGSPAPGAPPGRAACAARPGARRFRGAAAAREMESGPSGLGRADRGSARAGFAARPRRGAAAGLRLARPERGGRRPRAGRGRRGKIDRRARRPCPARAAGLRGRRRLARTARPGAPGRRSAPDRRTPPGRRRAGELLRRPAPWPGGHRPRQHPLFPRPEAGDRRLRSAGRQRGAGGRG